MDEPLIFVCLILFALAVFVVILGVNAIYKIRDILTELLKNGGGD